MTKTTKSDSADGAGESRQFDESQLCVHGVRIDTEQEVVLSLEASLTLSQAIDVYVTAQSRIVSQATVKTYYNAAHHLIAHYGEEKLITEMTKTDMVMWRTYLLDVKKFESHNRIDSDEKLSIHSVRRVMGTASGIFNWLVDYELLERNPLRGVRKPKAPRIEPKSISRGDYDKLLHAAARYYGSKDEFAAGYVARQVAVILFLASTGCRIGGMCGATLDKLQLGDSDGQVDLIEKFRGGGKQHTYFLSELACAALMEWLEHRPECEHNYIFCGIEGQALGQPLTASAVRQFLKRLAKRAKVDGRVNPHSFRHAAAREWIRNGADIATVSDLLGHSDLHVTQKHYARWLTSEMREKHNEINWV